MKSAPGSDLSFKNLLSHDLILNDEIKESIVHLLSQIKLNTCTLCLLYTSKTFVNQNISSNLCDLLRKYELYLSKRGVLEQWRLILFCKIGSDRHKILCLFIPQLFNEIFLINFKKC